MSFVSHPFLLRLFALAAFLLAASMAEAFRVQVPSNFDKLTPQQQSNYINPIMFNASQEQKTVARDRQDAIDTQVSQAGRQAQAAAEERRAEILAAEARVKPGTTAANAEDDAEATSMIPETSIFVYLILVALITWGAWRFIRRAIEIRKLRELDLPREIETP